MSEYNPTQNKHSPAMEDADALTLLGCCRSSLPTNHPSFTDQNNNTATTESQPILAFPKTLMEMMDYCDEMNFKHTEGSDKFCVTWLPDGKSFLVRDPTEFARTIIPKFFKPSKFTSFARKLYRWGFRQFTSLDTDGTAPPLDAVAFSAPCFSRDAKHELSKMKNGGGRGSEKKPKMTGNRRGTSTSKFNCNKNDNSSICNRKKKRISFVSMNTNESIDNDISDISSESSQGPMKKRKIGISAHSPITLDGCDMENTNENNVLLDGAVNLNSSDYFFGSSNNMIDRSDANNGAPTQAFCQQYHQHTSGALSDQAECRGNDALFQLLLSNIVANRNQSQSKNTQSLPQHTRVTSNTCHHVPGVAIAYDRQPLEGIAGFLQGVHSHKTTPNVTATYAETKSTCSVNSQSALLRHLESMKTPQHKTQLTFHSMLNANQDNELSFAMKNLIAQYNSIIARRQQTLSMMNAAMLKLQLQQKPQQQNDVDAAVSCLVQYMLHCNFY